MISQRFEISILERRVSWNSQRVNTYNIQKFTDDDGVRDESVHKTNGFWVLGFTLAMNHEWSAGHEAIAGCFATRAVQAASASEVPEMFTNEPEIVRREHNGDSGSPATVPHAAEEMSSASLSASETWGSEAMSMMDWSIDDT